MANCESNKHDDLISIVIPVYNTGKYLVNCLQSCIDQTYPNIEVVVVDDHSTDPYTQQILHEFEAKDSRFHIIYCPENRGQGYCRNLGVDESKGKYFAFVDSDDYLTPDFAEKMLEGIKEYNTDFVTCDVSKVLNDPSLKNLHKGFSINTLESQFNLIHARDRTVLKTSILMQQNCLMVFPANCYGKLFNIERYRAAGIAFADGEDARHCEDQDWKVNILISLKNCLILRFIGYKRVVRLGSVGSPNINGYRCCIASDCRFYNMIRHLETFEVYSTNLLRHMFNEATSLSRYTPDFAEREKIIPQLSKYLEQCDPDVLLNPYKYSSLGSICWYDFFMLMDSNPLAMMYFSLRPQHDVLSSDRVYTRELFEGLSSQGIQITSFNGSLSNTKTALQSILDIKKDFNKGRDPDKPEGGNKSALFLFKDNGVIYISATTSRTAPETYTNVDKLIIFRGAQQTLETSFKKSHAFDPVPDNPSANAIRKAIAEREKKMPGSFADFNKRKKKEEENKKKHTVREVEVFLQSKLVMISGGDLVTQQVCRNLKLADCKLIYLITDQKDLEFEVLGNNAEQLKAEFGAASENVVPTDMASLIEALSAKSKADNAYDRAIFAKETALERLNRAAEEKQEQRTKGDLQDETLPEDLTKLSDEELARLLSGDETDPEKEADIFRIPTTEDLKKLDQEIKTTAKAAKEAAEKVAQIRAKTVPAQVGSPVDSKYLFAPSEFDAVLTFSPELAQMFYDKYQIEAKALGYVLYPHVNVLPERKPEMITYPHPVSENGLAIFIKLVDAYTKRHPEAKFLVLQDEEDSFVPDLNKLHDNAGNTLAKLKFNLSALSVSSSKKVDPIKACAQTKVLLRFDLKDAASICNMPEALLNNIPVLATKHQRYAELVQDAGKLLDIPASTLKDPSCLPTDEEILPYVEALEALMTQDYTEQCQAAAQNLNFAKNVDAWAEHIYAAAQVKYEHDHPEDDRHL